MKTAQICSLRGYLSHTLLDQNIFFRLLDQERVELVRERGDEERRAAGCADYAAIHALDREWQANLHYAGKRWQSEEAQAKILALIDAVYAWKKYRTSALMDGAAAAVRVEIGEVTDFFGRLDVWLRQDEATRAAAAKRFWRPLLRVHDLARALDEHDREFYRYLY